MHLVQAAACTAVQPSALSACTEPGEAVGRPPLVAQEAKWGNIRNSRACGGRFAACSGQTTPAVDRGSGTGRTKNGGTRTAAARTHTPTVGPGGWRRLALFPGRPDAYPPLTYHCRADSGFRCNAPHLILRTEGDWKHKWDFGGWGEEHWKRVSGGPGPMGDLGRRA